jgi:hypothetical protein
LKKAQEKKKQASSVRPSCESSRLKSSKNAIPETSQPLPCNPTSSVPQPRPVHKELSRLPTIPEIPKEDNLTPPEVPNKDVETAAQVILGMASEMGDWASAASESSSDMSSAATGEIGGDKDSPEVSEDEGNNSDDEGVSITVSEP